MAVNCGKGGDCGKGGELRWNWHSKGIVNDEYPLLTKKEPCQGPVSGTGVRGVRGY